MLIQRTTTGKQYRGSLSGKLEGNIYDALPINRISRRVGCWLKTGGLHGTDGRIAQTVTEVAGDAEDLHGASG
jgi:hypothetical protein